jgi:hypothetical protein
LIDKKINETQHWTWYESLIEIWILRELLSEIDNLPPNN